MINILNRLFKRKCPSCNNNFQEIANPFNPVARLWKCSNCNISLWVLENKYQSWYFNNKWIASAKSEKDFKKYLKLKAFL
jgi:hypothetical protein